MNQVVLTGDDTINIDDRILSALGSGDAATLDFPGDVMSVKTGKNGNVVYAFNATGRQATLVVRVMLGSDDDRYLNSRVNQLLNNPVGFVLVSGEFIKKIGDGKGNVSSATYLMSGGVPSKEVKTKLNVEGDVEQALAEYTFIFGKAPRTIT